jgi:hypothetical protein
MKMPLLDQLLRCRHPAPMRVQVTKIGLGQRQDCSNYGAARHTTTKKTADGYSIVWCRWELPMIILQAKGSRSRKLMK